MKPLVRFLIAGSIAIAAINANAQVTSAQSADTDITVSLTLPQLIELEGLNDITIDAGSFLGANATGSDDFCVGGYGYSTYSIQFDSANASGTQFRMADSGTTPSYVNYNVDFANDLGSVSHIPAESGVALTGNERGVANIACATSGENRQLLVTVLQSDWENANALSTFSDTLTVTVTAE
ncbi:hypothetical protein [Microbulbifer aggregans]|uniref:hypothetical protein n=1 Tax=Microbulbifer aggregans TaxID=1769779 RepID=UPI001CFD444E|nr:hypothetical protein [Microbulbifer aggregans]